MTSADGVSDLGAGPFSGWPAGEDEGLSGLDEGGTAWCGADLPEVVLTNTTLLLSGVRPRIAEIGELAFQYDLRLCELCRSSLMCPAVPTCRLAPLGERHASAGWMQRNAETCFQDHRALARYGKIGQPPPQGLGKVGRGGVSPGCRDGDGVVGGHASFG